MCGWTNIEPKDGSKQILWERVSSDKIVSAKSPWYLWVPENKNNVSEAVLQSIFTAPFTGPLCFEFRFLTKCSSTTSTEHKLHIYYESADLPAPLNITDLNCPLPYTGWTKLKINLKSNLLLGRMFIQTPKDGNGGVAIDDIYLKPGKCDKDGIIYQTI